jgi:hypothetical protein
MMTPRWIIDNQILGEDHDLLDALRDSNTDFRLLFTKLGESPNLTAYDDRPTILYGPINFINKCSVSFTPGAWGFSKVMDCTNYYPYIPNEWLLNRKFIILPFGVLQTRIEKMIEDAGAPMFVRPNSGFKPFTGCVINSAQELAQIYPLPNPEMLCLVCTEYPISREFRFLIADREVVDGSEYGWVKDLKAKNNYVDPACFWLAQKVAKQDFQPDLVYTCVVCLVEGKPYFVELNSFASAGLYAMDKKKVVAKLNELARREFNDHGL